MTVILSLDIRPPGDPQADRNLEMSGIEPETFHMRSERSTTELHPLQYPPIRIRFPMSKNRNRIGKNIVGMYGQLLCVAFELLGKGYSVMPG